jgi:hypothetical protein
MTDGRHGSSKLSTLPREQREQEQVRLIETRKREARLALAKLGIEEMLCLDAEDGTLQSAAVPAQQLRAILTERRPHLVYLPFFSKSMQITAPPARSCWTPSPARTCSSSASATKCGRRCSRIAWCASTGRCR